MPRVDPRDRPSSPHRPFAAAAAPQGARSRDGSCRSAGRRECSVSIRDIACRPRTAHSRLPPLLHRKEPRPFSVGAPAGANAACRTARSPVATAPPIRGCRRSYIGRSRAGFCRSAGRRECRVSNREIARRHRTAHSRLPPLLQGPEAAPVHVGAPAGANAASLRPPVPWRACRAGAGGSCRRRPRSGCGGRGRPPRGRRAR